MSFCCGGLACVNVNPDWAKSGEWLEWGPPRNLVAGESYRLGELRSLCGELAENGYLLPVEARFVREPLNPYDSNAWRVEVAGVHVGYARRELAAVLSEALDPVKCSSFNVCGLLRGGSFDAPNIGVHVWLERRTSEGPEIVFDDDVREVAWPPYEGEGGTPGQRPFSAAYRDGKS
jgi:HIRAN domain